MSEAGSSQQEFRQIGSIIAWMFCLLYGSVIHCSEFCFQGRKVLKTWGEVCRSPFSSQKWRDSKRTMSCWIIRPANPGHGSTTGIILWIWNAVKRSSLNQIKTKLCGVPSRAHNLQLSMNFDRVQREQKERVSGVGGGRTGERYFSFGQTGSRISNDVTWRK